MSRLFYATKSSRWKFVAFVIATSAGAGVADARGAVEVGFAAGLSPGDEQAVAPSDNANTHTARQRITLPLAKLVSVPPYCLILAAFNLFTFLEIYIKSFKAERLLNVDSCPFCNPLDLVSLIFRKQVQACGACAGPCPSPCAPATLVSILAGKALMCLQLSLRLRWR